MTSSPSPTAGAPTRPTFAQALAVWIKIGLLSFGGPTGQISLMHQELVERRRWISDSRFLHGLNYCMLLPGPEAQQLAVYIGWLLHRTWGGIVAGALFVIPGAILLWGVVYGQVPWIEAIFYGLKAAVLGIVAAAVIRIGRKALKNPVMWTIAAAAFVGIFFLRLPFPLIVLSAGLIGLLGGRFFPGIFLIAQGHGGRRPRPSLTMKRPSTPLTGPVPPARLAPRWFGCSCGSSQSGLSHCGLDGSTCCFNKRYFSRKLQWLHSAVRMRFFPTWLSRPLRRTAG